MPLDRYLDHLARTPNARGRLPSPASVRAARADLAGITRWWEQRRSLAFAPDLLSEADILAWMQARQEAGTTTGSCAIETCIQNWKPYPIVLHFSHDPHLQEVARWRHP